MCRTNALESLVIAGFVRGLSVRDVEATLAEALGSEATLSKSTVSRVCEAIKTVLEPIFEADFQPCSYGFRPKRRAHDAIAEIHHFTSRSYEWVLEGDITACFDEISTRRSRWTGCGPGSETSASRAW